MLDIIIQGILSLFLVFIMAFIAYSIYNREYVNRFNEIITYGNKKKVIIFSGRFEFCSNSINFETYNRNLLGYRDINPSKNQNGGAEYTYNFWLLYHINSDTLDVNDGMPRINKLSNPHDYIILFFKGSAMKSMKYKSSNYECSEPGDKKILIKNPLMKLRNDGKEIIVEYNNINYPETYNYNAQSLSCDILMTTDKETDNNKKIEDKDRDTLSSNKFGIKDMNVNYYNKKFNMITLVFQEVPPNEDVFNANRANYRIYLNGELVEDRLANTNNLENLVSNENDQKQSDNSFRSRVIKNNNSKLTINPKFYDNILQSDATTDAKKLNNSLEKIKLNDKITDICPLQMADFTYFNYALSSSEINNLYRKGYNPEIAIIENSLQLTTYDYSAKYDPYPIRDQSKPI
jgi:hypothetical protein